MNSSITKLTYYILAACFIAACKPEGKKSSRSLISIHQTNDAKTLNPLIARDAFSNYVGLHLFQSLVAFDYKTEEIVGVLANAEAEAEIDSSGKLLVHYDLRDEAAFDDGSPITAKDVLFSLKAHLCPGVQSSSTRFFQFIDQVILYSEDSKKVTFVCSEFNSSTAYFCGSIIIFPKKTYDSNNLLADFTIAELKVDSNKDHPKLKSFAESFNSNEFAQNIELVNGSGPYKISKWEKGQYLSLKKKEDWWGNQVQRTNSYFNINAEELRFEIINDQSTALLALKSGKIDFTASISAKDYQQLKSDSSFVKKHSLKSQERSGYQLLGFNLAHELLKLPEVRQAFAYCIPKQKIIENVYYGLAHPTSAPLNASDAKPYEKSLNTYPYNMTKADSILNANDWKDSNGDGILDKEIEGQLKSLQFNYAYNSGNDERKAVGLILKEQAARLGISLSVNTYDWATYTEKVRNGELELFFWGVTSNLLPPDYSIYYHSQAITSGRNIFRYQTPLVDSLINKINQAQVESARKEYMQQFFAQLNRDLPCVFLWTLEEGIAYSKDLENVITSKVRPHYWAPAFKWKQP